MLKGLPFYQDKLHEETVYKRFQEILNKVRPLRFTGAFSRTRSNPHHHRQARNNKVSKNESDLKEFEDALEEHRAKGTEDQEVQKKVAKEKKKAKARRKSSSSLAFQDDPDWGFGFDSEKKTGFRTTFLAMTLH